MGGGALSFEQNYQQSKVQLMGLKIDFENLFSLYENYAIRRLQEQFILNVAAEVMFTEAVKYMEQEMEEVDQQERIDNPPREIIM